MHTHRSRDRTYPWATRTRNRTAAPPSRQPTQHRSSNARSIARRRLIITASRTLSWTTDWATGLRAAARSSTRTRCPPSQVRVKLRLKATVNRQSLYYPGLLLFKTIVDDKNIHIDRSLSIHFCRYIDVTLPNDLFPSHYPNLNQKCTITNPKLTLTLTLP